MGGKHLKRLRAEKSKVKLKKKLLPKGQNITDTTFKVKKITLVEQLKNVGENEPVSSRNVSLKDLLSHLHHHNMTTRLSALTGLEELIKGFPEVLNGPSVRSIITNLLDVVSDCEHKVRVASVKLIDALFCQLTKEQIASFHDLLNVHLACTMTHIDIAKQRDSLLLLNVVIQHAPEAIKRHQRILIQNFARFLSAYKYGSQCELLLNKKSKGDLILSRADILQKLYAILKIIYQPFTVINLKEVMEIQVRDFSSFSLRSQSRIYKDIPNLSEIFKKSGITALNEISQDTEELESHLTLIMPILFEVWSEFSPSTQNDGFNLECILNENVAQLLLVILQIIQLFYERILEVGNENVKAQFIKNWRNAFSNSFLSNFPYVTPASPVKRAPQPDFTGREDELRKCSMYAKQNLLICQLYYGLKIQNKAKDLESRIGDYVINSLKRRPVDDIEALVSVIEVIFFSTSATKRKEVFLTAVIKAFFSTNDVKMRSRLFDVLTKISLNDHLVCYHKNPIFVKWLKTLPNELCKPEVKLDLVEAILKLIVREDCSYILEEVEKKACDIVELLPSIRVESVDQFRGQKLIGGILYRCRKDVIEPIVAQGKLSGEAYPEKLKNYLQNIFTFKVKSQV